MITSPSNPKVKYVRRLQSDRRFRMREQVFAVEGTRWLSELTHHARSPVLILYTQAWCDIDDHASILQRHTTNVQVVSDQVMAAASATHTPPGILAVVRMQPAPLPATPSFVLVLDEVRNPGNLGTLLRSASAAGVEAVLLGPRCADAFNPKTLRGGMGAHLRLPIHQVTWDETSQIVSTMGVWLATADGNMVYTDVDWRQPSALVIGNEARGTGEQAELLADGRIRIPMAADSESLNAAVAGSVILFEAARQRRIVGSSPTEI